MSLIDVAHRAMLQAGGISPDSTWYFAEILLLAAAIFLCGAVVEFLRKKIIQEPFMKVIDKIDFSNFDRWINME